MEVSPMAGFSLNSAPPVLLPLTMPVKTETSSPSPASSSDPFTPPKQKRKAANTESLSSTGSSDKKPSSAKSTFKKPRTTPTSTMTPAIKEALIDHMMRIACSAVKKEELALEVSLLEDSG
jgi:hypothetical protein